MSSRRKRGNDERLFKITLATAAIGLATSIVNLLIKIIEWLTNR